MNNEEDPTLKLMLPVSQTNIILTALAELPFKLSDPVIKSIVSQADLQLNPPPVEE